MTNKNEPLTDKQEVCPLLHYKVTTNDGIFEVPGHYINTLKEEVLCIMHIDFSKDPEEGTITGLFRYWNSCVLIDPKVGGLDPRVNDVQSK